MFIFVPAQKEPTESSWQFPKRFWPSSHICSKKIFFEISRYLRTLRKVFNVKVSANSLNNFLEVREEYPHRRVKCYLTSKTFITAVLNFFAHDAHWFDSWLWIQLPSSEISKFTEMLLGTSRQIRSSLRTPRTFSEHKLMNRRSLPCDAESWLVGFKASGLSNQRASKS